ANAFRIGLTSYGDWDGNRETFDKAASKVFDRLWNRQDFFEDFKSLMKCAEELEDKLPLSRPVRLDETMKLKTFCDCYLSSRAQFATQHAIAKGKSPMSSSEQWDSIDS
ncbi:MAG TPA: hypothetical protein VHP80_19235, partial [Candidatus Acidoferrum sp.]|nr:hypothetical protein [Candidatus Acidoferrum sp.]